KAMRTDVKAAYNGAASTVLLARAIMRQSAHQSADGFRTRIGYINFASDPAGEKHNDAVSKLDDLIEVGADHHHTQPRFAGHQNGIAHVVDGPDVQAAKRIVGNE